MKRISLHAQLILALESAIRELESCYKIAMALHGDDLGSPERLTLKYMKQTLNRAKRHQEVSS